VYLFYELYPAVVRSTSLLACRLTESGEFQHWLKTSNCRLWLFGIPGAGKTVLASSVIEEAMKQSDGENAVAFFYCDYKNQASQDPVNILGSIASHLARQNPECFHRLQLYYRDCNPEGDLCRLPKVRELISVILDMVSALDDVAVIIDGLDECGKRTAEVVHLLDSLGKESRRIKTLFLSRNEQHIRDILHGYVEISIAARSSDLKLYVASEIELRTRSKRLRIKSDQLKEHILDTLVNDADGMYVLFHLTKLGQVLTNTVTDEHSLGFAG
jgi:Cdc6-like AAA superfamily ATPase